MYWWCSHRISNRFLCLCLQSLRLSKNLVRDAERDLLHQVNERECQLLIERWQSEECINAIMSFFSSKLWTHAMLRDCFTSPTLVTNLHTCTRFKKLHSCEKCRSKVSPPPCRPDITKSIVMYSTTNALIYKVSSFFKAMFNCIISCPHQARVWYIC